MMIRFMLMLIACLFVLAGCGGDDSATVADLPAGAGTFAAGGDFSVGDSPRSVAIGDLNGDGILDLAVANAGSVVNDLIVDGSDNVSVLVGIGDGTFAPVTAADIYEAGTAPVFVATEDLNADGILDLVVANSGSDNVSVLLGNNDGSGKSDGTFAALGYDVGTNPFSLALGYLNADLILDLVVVNSGSANVSVLMGNGDGTFVVAVDYAVGESPRSVAIGDLDGDLILDLAVANFRSLNVSVLAGKADGTFATADNYVVGASPRSLVIGDLDGD